MDDEQILEFQANTANGIVCRLNASRRDTAVTRAIELLLGRIVGAGNSLRVLHNHAPHEFDFDGAMILRGIYDAMLQALFILHDPAKRDERAQDYLDFYWVEKEKTIGLFDGNRTYLSRRISQSARRPSAEPAIKQEIQRVRPRFENSNGRLRNHWYKGSLRELAGAVGFEAEYEILQQQLSGAVHASAYTLQDGSYYRGFLLLDFAWRLSFRVLGSAAEYVGIELDEAERELVGLSRTNVFDLPNTS
ncbi:MAG: hypothetical protein HQ567_08840 [Candidatus Nealsonbacteria bacterium]|nr:hypothetical protein [Candidatus Nealsonbacteria bacterium]